MAGHSKWSQIKRKKGALDKQRGKIISKHVRAIQSAVRSGNSGDPNVNLPLRNALSAAKSDNVAVDNIDRAIERALGGGEGGNFEPAFYEGYGPAGVAMLVETLTDNKNRTAGEVRHVFSKHGGNMSGSTAWQFDTKGMITVEQVGDAVEEAAIELGADDLEMDEGTSVIYTPPAELYAIVEGLQERGMPVDVVQLTKLPQTQTALTPEEARKVMNFLESLEDLDDVQNVYTTADLDSVGDDVDTVG
ncbi:MAG TPA: YebC/PmpR family DNA-binding transcriptional regulator [Trueperaceae bacterium]|nr:YebC/PmpR family DNA-binding transcriptional regulator [Trueperaceae bacterium]